ncbi:hypothetical protein BH18CHL2_BH18CHL2_06940 [soil metagenome]
MPERCCRSCWRRRGRGGCGGRHAAPFGRRSTRSAPDSAPRAPSTPRTSMIRRLPQRRAACGPTLGRTRVRVQRSAGATRGVREDGVPPQLVVAARALPVCTQDPFVVRVVASLVRRAALRAVRPVVRSVSRRSLSVALDPRSVVRPPLLAPRRVISLPGPVLTLSRKKTLSMLLLVPPHTLTGLRALRRQFLRVLDKPRTFPCVARADVLADVLAAFRFLFRYEVLLLPRHP